MTTTKKLKTKPAAGPATPAKPKKRTTRTAPLGNAASRAATPHNSGSTPAPGSTLTVKVARFVQEYMLDFNGRQAAIRAGYSAKTADQQASRLLRSVKVREALAPKQAEVVAERAAAINRMELTVDRTRLEIARIAYFDPRRLFDKDGRPLAVTELDDDTAAVISGLEVLEAYEGSGEDRAKVGEIKKWKIADKNSALDKAAKILGDYKQEKKPELAEALAGFIGQLHQSSAGRLKFKPRPG